MRAGGGLVPVLPDCLGPIAGMAYAALAEFYRMQGEYPEAEPLFQRALAVLEKRWVLSVPMWRKTWKTTPI